MTEIKAESVLICYNRGCGTKFDPSINNEESCTYHPGVPVFHDAYKKWSCCDKKTTDFTEFLNIKGCSKSYHSNIKPPEPQKEANDDETFNKKEVPTYVMPQPLKESVEERPDTNAPTIKLGANVGPSLKPLLDQLIKQKSIDTTDNTGAVKIGTNCKNGGCKGIYRNENSDHETCIYHSGIPIFHEGLKYWTCCVKRTTDFDSFLEQVGCTTGTHLWHKPKKSEAMSCRYDWHQTGSSVVISVYSKCPLPDSSYIEANAVKLVIHIIFGQEENVFHSELPLFGVIDVNNSSVMYLGSKVEINLKKVESLLWKDLTWTQKSSPLKKDMKNLNITKT